MLCKYNFIIPCFLLAEFGTGSLSLLVNLLSALVLISLNKTVVPKPLLEYDSIDYNLLSGVSDVQ